MRALLVGAGGMGKTWARNLASTEDVHLAGWVDVRPGAASEASRELAIDPDYQGEDLRKAADTCAPDFVVDVSSPEAHHDVTVAALRMGLPVLGEKPMAATMEQARAMVKASEDAGKLYMVSQSRRYDSGLVAYRRLIQERLGGLGILNADFYIGAHFGGFRDEMDSPLLLDMAIHTFDEARFLSGQDGLWVYAEEFNPAWSWYKGAACANAVFEMSGGLRFCYRGSWCSDGMPTSWDGNWRAVGPNGAACWDRNEEPVAETVLQHEGFMRPVERTQQPKAELKAGIAGSLQEFLNSLATGSKPQGECHDNIRSLAMVFAAVESSKTQKRVSVSV